MKIYKSSSYQKLSKGKDWDPNPWAVCHSRLDKDEDPEKFERCVKKVKSKQNKKAEVGAVWTPQMEEELEQQELEKKRKRYREKGDYAFPHIKRPGRGKGVPRILQRKGLDTIVTDDDWEAVVNKMHNLQLAKSNKKIK